MRKLILRILICIFAVTAAFSGYQLFQIFREYTTAENTYEELQQFVSMPDMETEQTAEAERPQTAETTDGEDSVQWPEVDFAALQEINPDVVAWLCIEGTGISYPVVRGENNDYYLRHMIDGTDNGAGSIFLDCENETDFTDRHSILYGHHMKNGTMFAELVNYKEQAFYEDHPAALLLTPERNYVVELFSGFVADAAGEAWTRSFATEADYAAWLESSMERSCFKADVTPGIEDRILTLSTCTYEYDDARFVVQGILR